MVEIKLNKQWVITSDAQQYILNKLVKQTKPSKLRALGAMYLQPVCFYTSITSLLLHAPHVIGRHENAKTLEELIKAVKSYEKIIKDAFKV
jgi:hypothetical protein